MFRRLLVAFAGSLHAQRALAESIELAATNDGTLTVMTVVPQPSSWALRGGHDVAVTVDALSEQTKREG
jgi:nucleotide-binding universal stress UspA family protein